ncbi:MAG: hypothetical protein WC044_04320 [Crocinitomicaceae bacterium]
MKNSLFCIFLLVSSFSQAKYDDSTVYFTRFKDKLILYSDFGYASAPFSIKYKFADNLGVIHYKNNFNPVLGFGGSYKWFSLRLSFALKGTSRSKKNYGNTRYFDVGFNFQLKKWYFDVDARNYIGYSIKNAYRWNDTLNKLTPNDIRPNTNSISLSINTWYFFNKHFNMPSIHGKTGHYDKRLGTFYLKPTFVVHGISNGGGTIIPDDLIDTLNSKTSSDVFSSIDLGIVPGYAHVERYKNWQFCAFFGLGAVTQLKFYNVNSYQRSFLGLAPRYDIKLIGGYSVPKYFVFLNLEFDNKSIKFIDLKYRQSFYYIRLTAGIRLDTKKSKRESK